MKKMSTKSIYDMVIGEEAKILDINIKDKQINHRFIDLGIAPFAKIILLNKFNFDNLYIIQVDDVQICIRRKDARLIQVEV